MTHSHSLILAELPVLLSYVYFCRIRLKSYLHIFQQEEYDNARFLGWLCRSFSFDRSASLAICAIWALRLLVAKAAIPLTVSVALLFLVIAERERRYQGNAKKPLVMTIRARRILYGAWLIETVLAAVLVVWTTQFGVWLVLVHIIPLCLVVANLLLAPVEKRIKARYWREAHAKIEKLQPLIVGVTGSFGKTSVKHILGHVLQFYGPTLITPGSVNTPMGISRVIREQLRSSHQFFIVEMGAYGIGSIAELCRLTPPNMGVLTAIGAAHLERFGSQDHTARAKMELSDAVLAHGGRMIINESILSFPPVSERLASNCERFVTCGMGSGDLALSEIKQERSGLKFKISAGGNDYAVAVPLFGTHQAMNVTLAFAAARELGMSPTDILTALKSVSQISHRLEVKKMPSGALIIDDAYNSNPAGFKSALGVLKTLKSETGRCYLITPGMVELGKDHADEHYRLGKLAGEIVDSLFIVGKSRIPTFVTGFQAGSNNQKPIFEFGTFGAAYADLMNRFMSDDVVLIENDLPDLYERRLQL